MTAAELCDLSGDPVACGLLRKLARWPQLPVVLAALVDRMRELGHEKEAGKVKNEYDAWRWWWRDDANLLPRRRYQRSLRRLRARMVELFGPFETLPVKEGKGDTGAPQEAPG